MKRIKFQTLAKLGTCMLLILLLVKVFIGEWVYIPSDSMFPTISAKSLVWNSKITYGALMPQRIVETPVLNLLCLIPAVAKADKKTNWGYHRVWGYSSPQRMDVVIFKWDENETQLYVKRIIGMPKDTIQLKDGIVYINNKAIEEKGISYVDFTERPYFIRPKTHNSDEDIRKGKRHVYFVCAHDHLVFYDYFGCSRYGQTADQPTANE